MVTKPLRFAGKSLVVNCSTSAAGSLRVEIQDEGGSVMPGYDLDDCQEIVGDHIERAVSWTDGADVSALAGEAIRLRFVVVDGDLYAIRFTS